MLSVMHMQKKHAKQALQEPCNQFHLHWCARRNFFGTILCSCQYLANCFGFIALPSTLVFECSAMLWGALDFVLTRLPACMQQ